MTKFYSADQTASASAQCAEAASPCSSLMIILGAMIMASIFVLLLSRYLLVRISILLLTVLVGIGKIEYRSKSFEFGRA